MIRENILMALRSLGGAKVRSFLTMLGIIIGVSSVVAIVSIGQGVKDAVAGQVNSLGAGTLIIQSGSGFSGGSGGFRSSLGTSTLTNADTASLQQLGSVSRVAPVGLVSGLVAHGTATSPATSIDASTPDFQPILNLKLGEGRWLSASDNDQNVVVLGSSTKTDLFGDKAALGQTVQLRGQAFTVIGVTKATSSSALSSNGSEANAAYIPWGAAQTLANGNLSILEILAQAKDPNQVNATVDAINTQLKKNHGGQKDFNVETQADLLSTFNTIFNLLTTFIAAIASISLLVGGIGIMNIMLVSVTERTREIGIRKAIGATSRTVLGQFLIEALVLSLFGGLLGILAGYGMATLGGQLAKITPGYTLSSILTAFGISAGVGVIFGIAPAIKAARMRPIDALRYE